LSALLRAGEWNQFRGPASSGVADDKANPPVEFAPDNNVLWKTALPMGKSSPVFAGNRLFLTAHAGDELLTIALDRRNGKELWRASIARPRKEPRHKLNDPASPTPVTDGRNVFVFFADYGLAAYSASNGKEL
jgi:outer membrane protein assembly factor BamB